MTISSPNDFLEIYSEKPDTPEGRMADCYRNAKATFESLKKELVGHIRGSFEKGRIVPCFSQTPDVSALLDRIQVAEGEFSKDGDGY